MSLMWGCGPASSLCMPRSVLSHRLSRSDSTWQALVPAVRDGNLSAADTTADGQQLGQWWRGGKGS